MMHLGLLASQVLNSVLDPEGNLDYLVKPTHFANGKTESQRGELTSRKSYSWLVTESGLESIRISQLLMQFPFKTTQ